MKLSWRKEKSTALENEIERLVKSMKSVAPDSNAYAIMAKNLNLLYETKSKEIVKKKISPDTLAIVAGNLAGIMLILHYEQLGVISSKAVGFIIKGRV